MRANEYLYRSLVHSALMRCGGIKSHFDRFWPRVLTDIAEGREFPDRESVTRTPDDSLPCSRLSPARLSNPISPPPAICRTKTPSVRRNDTCNLRIPSRIRRLKWKPLLTDRRFDDQ